METTTPAIKSVAQWETTQCIHIEQDGQWPKDLIIRQLEHFPGWQCLSDANGHTRLQKKFSFKNFEQTKKAIAHTIEVADAQDHHPEVTFTYNTLALSWNTHSAGGISNNDWACAAKVEQLIDLIN